MCVCVCVWNSDSFVGFRKIDQGAQHFSQQQLLSALQALGPANRIKSSSWDQKSVDRTLERWSNEKQRKANQLEESRTAGAKFWRSQKQKLVLGKLRYFKLFTKMERRAQAAPHVAKAKWKAIELQRNFGCRDL